MTRLLFAGPASIEELAAALDRPRRAYPALDRSAGAGGLCPPRRCPHRFDQPRASVDRPDLVAAAGRRRAPPRQLRAARSRAVEQFPGAGPGHPGATGAERCRAWLEQPGTLARSPHLRGGRSRRLASARRGLRRGRARPSVAARRSGGPRRPERVPLRARLPGVHRSHASCVRRDAADRPGPRVDCRNHAVARRDRRRHGVGTQSRLSIAFKRATGFTPAAWRRSGGR